MKKCSLCHKPSEKLYKCFWVRRKIQKLYTYHSATGGEIEFSKTLTGKCCKECILKEDYPPFQKPYCKETIKICNDEFPAEIFLEAEEFVINGEKVSKNNLVEVSKNNYQLINT